MAISNSPHPSLLQTKGGFVKAVWRGILVSKVGFQCEGSQCCPRMVTRLEIAGEARTLNRVLERRMQVVDNFCEDICRSLIAILIQQEDAHAPSSHREILHRRGLVSIFLCQYGVPMNNRSIMVGSVDGDTLLVNVPTTSSSENDWCNTHMTCCSTTTLTFLCIL